MEAPCPLWEIFAQASARIEVSASGLIITISGLAPIQGVGSQTITINPIAFEDAANSTSAITAVSGQSASSATAFLAPGSQGEIDVISGTSVTGLTSGKYIMKSGSAWYQLANGTAMIPTPVTSLELAMTVRKCNYITFTIILLNYFAGEIV